MTLRKFGLTSYEAKAYETLLQFGSLTAHATAKQSGVPSGKIYPTLDALSSKGFVTIAGKPKFYSAVPLEISIQKVVDREQKNIAQLQHTAQKLIQEYSSLPKSISSPSDVVEVYFSHSSAFARSIVLHHQTKKYWKTLSALSINKEHLDATVDAMRRGVKVQAITSMDVTNKERISLWRERKIPVTVIASLPFRASIYDDRGVILRFEEGKQYVSVHIRNVKLAKGMKEMFDEMWKKRFT